MKRRSSIFLTLALCAAFLLPAAPAVAQGGGGCTSPLVGGRLPEGIMDEMEAGEPYQECLQCIDIPGVGQIGIVLTMDNYEDAEGRHYLVPNFFTSMYMAFTGWAPEFSVGPVDAALNGFELVAALMGRYENVGGIFEELGIDFGQAVELTGRTATNFVDWSDFTVEDVVGVFRELAGDAGFWIRLNVMALRDDWARGSAISWRSMVLVYCDSPFDPDPLPREDPVSFPTTNWSPPATPTPSDGTPPPPPTFTTPQPTPSPPATPTPGIPSTPTPTATPQGGCAESSVSRSGVGTILFEKLAPPYPVVVGQDDSKRGVDVHLRIVSPAVIYTYERYEVVSSETKCVHDNGTRKDENYDGCKFGWEGWSKKTTEKWGCVRYEEVYADPVDLGTLRVRAILTDASRAWIDGALAARYPGAKVRHGDWELIPKFGWGAYDGIGGDKVYTLDATLENIPFEDPGQYEMLVSGRTTGTPYTNAVGFDYSGGLFDVSLIEVVLIE